MIAQENALDFVKYAAIHFRLFIRTTGQKGTKPAENSKAH